MQGATGRAIIESLSAHGIEFEATPFVGDLRTVDQVCEALEMPASQICKAMLVRPEGRPALVAGIPGDRRLDLRRLAEQIGVGNVELVRRSEVESISGVPAGAVTPLLRLVRAELDVALDEDLMSAGVVNVSSGDPSWGITLSAAALRELTGARLVALA